MTTNLFLADDDMDRLYHALGRPADPRVESYRNYFSVGRNTELAGRFRASEYWEEYPTPSTDRLTIFTVTNAGRIALVAHLMTISGDQWIEKV